MPEKYIMKAPWLFSICCLFLLFSCKAPEAGLAASDCGEKVRFDFTACETDAWVFATVEDPSVRYGFIPSKSQQTFIQNVLDDDPDQIFYFSGTETTPFPGIAFCQIPDPPYEMVEFGCMDIP